MSIELKMPALSPTMEEGTLAKWLVKVGDSVSSGDLLAEIETDKATMEFEAIDEGVIKELLVAEGTDGVKVGTVIAVIASEDDDAAAGAAKPSSPPVGEEKGGGPVASATEKTPPPATTGQIHTVADATAPTPTLPTGRRRRRAPTGREIE